MSKQDGVGIVDFWARLEPAVIAVAFEGPVDNIEALFHALGEFAISGTALKVDTQVTLERSLPESEMKTLERSLENLGARVQTTQPD